MTDHEKELRDFYFRWIKRSLALHFGGAFLALGAEFIPAPVVSQTVVGWIVLVGFAISFVGIVDFSGLLFQRKRVFASLDVADEYGLKPAHPLLFLLQWWRSLR
jgi:hypothetical protein